MELVAVGVLDCGRPLLDGGGLAQSLGLGLCLAMLGGYGVPAQVMAKVDEALRLHLQLSGSV